MMIRAITEKLHAELVPVGELKTHDLGPEFCAALDVTDAQNHMADFLDSNRRFFVCHKWLLSMLIFEALSLPSKVGDSYHGKTVKAKRIIREKPL
jgi:hypothetical protein